MASLIFDSAFNSAPTRESQICILHTSHRIGCPTFYLSAFSIPRLTASNQGTCEASLFFHFHPSASSGASVKTQVMVADTLPLNSLCFTHLVSLCLFSHTFLDICGINNSKQPVVSPTLPTSVSSGTSW